MLLCTTKLLSILHPPKKQNKKPPQKPINMSLCISEMVQTRMLLGYLENKMLASMIYILLHLQNSCSKATANVTRLSTAGCRLKTHTNQFCCNAAFGRVEAMVIFSLVILKVLAISFQKGNTESSLFCAGCSFDLFIINCEWESKGYKHRQAHSSELPIPVTQ